MARMYPNLHHGKGPAQREDPSRKGSDTWSYAARCLERMAIVRALSSTHQAAGLHSSTPASRHRSTTLCQRGPGSPAGASGERDSASGSARRSKLYANRRSPTHLSLSDSPSRPRLQPLLLRVDDPALEYGRVDRSERAFAGSYLKTYLFAESVDPSRRHLPRDHMDFDVITANEIMMHIARAQGPMRC
jgi:hypothetical protein